jgi:hypothetical protein
MGKRQHVPLQERLLALTGERGVEGSARAAQPHDEHPALDQLAADAGAEFTEVDLGLGAGFMSLRNGHLKMLEAQFNPTTRDIARHTNLRAGCAMLGN